MKTKMHSFFMMTAATLIMAVGIYFFKFTNNFTFGGITGLAVLVAKSGLISASDFSFAANMILLVLGAVILGRKFVAKTAYCSVLLSVLLSLFERIWPMHQPFTNEPLLEVIFAIVLPAFGSAVLFNIGASSGGTDSVAINLKKYTSIDIGRALMLSDVAITVAGFFVFDVEVGLYSCLGLAFRSVLVDNFIESLNLSKYFNVFCSRPEPICDFIVHELNRSATICDGQGAFTGSQKYIIFTALNRHQAVLLRNFIKKEDPSAFILISNTSEIIGKGFHSV